MTEVRRRCVFYVSGFDPKGAPYYHKLYAEQSARQSRLNGWHYEVGNRRRTAEGAPFWTIRAADGAGADVETHYEFMRWDDIVRAHWPKSTPALWRAIVRTSLYYIRHGALQRMMRFSWPPGLALTLPFVLLAAVFVGAPLIGVATLLLMYGAGFPLWLGAAGGVLLAAVVAGLAYGIERRLSLYWIMRSYAFSARQAKGEVPALEERLDEHARRLVRRVAENVDDEILIVGHSSGIVMALSILARAAALDPDLDRRGPKLNLLSLGQWVPVVGALPTAAGFRAEMVRAACLPGVEWLDFSAPPDGCCFALADPFEVCGVARPAGAPVRPKLLNPRFAHMFDAKPYEALRKDRLALHFQYLMASDKATDYDYFLITAGPLSLDARYAEAPSITDFRRLRLF